MHRREYERLAQFSFARKDAMVAPILSERTAEDHVTNVEIAWLFDQHRMTFAKSFGWWDIVNSGGRVGMLASIDMCFLSEVWGTDEVQVSTAVEAIGTCSYTLAQIMRQQEKPVAVARSTLVLVGLNGPEPLPQSARDLMTEGLLRKFRNEPPAALPPVR